MATAVVPSAHDAPFAADEVAVVTGAGAGIGRAIALRLAREGCRLALVDRDADSLADVAAAVGEFGVESAVLVGDVTDKALTGALTTEVVEVLDKEPDLGFGVGSADADAVRPAAAAQGDGADEADGQKPSDRARGVCSSSSSA